MKLPTAACFLLATTIIVSADIVLENELIISNEIFDLNYAMDSDVEAARQRNETQFYCIFRSKWTIEDHPAHFPKLARFSTPVLFSHTKQYTPFLKNREANYGIEVIAEVRLVMNWCRFSFSSIVGSHDSFSVLLFLSSSLLYLSLLLFPGRIYYENARANYSSR